MHADVAGDANSRNPRGSKINKRESANELNSLVRTHTPQTHLESTPKKPQHLEIEARDIRELTSRLSEIFEQGGIWSSVVEEGIVGVYLTEINRQGTLLMAYNDLNERKLDKMNLLSDL